MPNGGPSQGSQDLGSALHAPGTIVANQYVASPNGQYDLCMQADGNLCLYTQGRFLWATWTQGHPGAYAVMQSDGNFCVYPAGGGTPLWDSGSIGGSCTFSVGDNADLVITDGAGKTVWSAGIYNWQLAPNEQLLPGEYLTAPGGQYYLAMQTDGNLCLYTQQGRLLWASSTQGNPGAYAVMQSDGNFCIYPAGGGTELWMTATQAWPGSTFCVQDDGNLCIYPSNGGGDVWASGSQNSTLAASEKLLPGDFLASPDEQYFLYMQTDGNFCLYRQGRLLWASWTQGHPGAYAVMQSDGNLCIYPAGGGTELWMTATQAWPGSTLRVQDDGNVVVYSPTNAAVWATNTAGANTSSSAGVGDDYPQYSEKRSPRLCR